MTIHTETARIEAREELKKLPDMGDLKALVIALHGEVVALALEPDRETWRRLYTEDLYRIAKVLAP